MNSGWVKIHRKILDSRFGKNIEMLGFWAYLILVANHKENYFTPSGIALGQGQIITGRKRISAETGLNESKVERLLKKLEIEHQIEQQKTTKYRIITITNWHLYQSSEQQVEQQANNKRTTSEQQVNTKQEHKNIRTKEYKNIYADKIAEVIKHLNTVNDSKFECKSKSTVKSVTGVLKQGYSINDCKLVVNWKFKEWSNSEKMRKFIRPDTLFGSKFDIYLAEARSQESKTNELINLIKGN